MKLARIKSSVETETLRLAGKIGEVWGFTTPSHSGVEVIGISDSDYALNIFFEETGEQHWIVRELLELLDHDPRLEATIDGSRRVYRSWGVWEELPPSAE